MLRCLPFVIVACSFIGTGETMAQQVQARQFEAQQVEAQRARVQIAEAIFLADSNSEPGDAMDEQAARNEQLRTVLTRLANGLKEGGGDNLIAEVWDYEKGVVDDNRISREHKIDSFDVRGTMKMNDWLRQYVSHEVTQKWSRGELRAHANDRGQLVASFFENGHRYRMEFDQQGDCWRIVRLSINFALL